MNQCVGSWNAEFELRKTVESKFEERCVSNAKFLKLKIEGK